MPVNITWRNQSYWTFVRLCYTCIFSAFGFAFHLKHMLVWTVGNCRGYQPHHGRTHLTASITKDVITEQTKEVILKSSLFTAEGLCLTSLAPQDSQKQSYTCATDLILLGSRNEGKASENREVYNLLMHIVPISRYGHSTGRHTASLWVPPIWAWYTELFSSGSNAKNKFKTKHFQLLFNGV